MKGRILEKMAAAACALALAVGVMSGAVFARDEEPAAEPAAPEPTFVVLDMDLGFDASPADALEELEGEASPTELYAYRDTPIEVTDNRADIPITVNGEAAGACEIIGGAPWYGAAALCRALGLEIETQFDGETLVITGDIDLTATADEIFFTCSDRYLLLEEGVRIREGDALLPMELLSKCLGVAVAWDRVLWNVSVTAQEIHPLESGATYYDDTDIYWLSRVIYAEAGNQSLLGKIAVGNVVLNRVADSAFAGQNSVYDVIFAKNQFEVVINGMIYMEPDSSSRTAAKLALEGYDVSGGATFFATYDFGDGYECVKWIGDHCFMTAA